MADTNSFDCDRNLSKKAAVILSGCGVMDGSEIHEAVVTILSLKKAGAEISFFAPNIKQFDVVNHLEAKSYQGQSRNVLEESARIARGQISKLDDFRARDFDAVFFPGGFGAAKNLCDFAINGADCKVEESVLRVIKDSLENNVKLGFICIAPVIAAKAIGAGVELTIGNDASTASAIEAMGAVHVECSATSFVKDSKLPVYSTPAYMLAKDIAELETGISSMVSAMLA